MKTVLQIIVIVVLMMTAVIARGQSDIIYSNVKMNRVAFNPAAIENNGAINARLDVRQQWIGFPDAPSIQFLNVSDFFQNSNMGVSLTVTNQTAGAERQQLVKAGYTYHIFFNGGHQLNLGAGAGILFRKLDYSKLIYEEDEENIPVTDERKILPDFEFGLEYKYKGLTAGFSSNHITTPDKKATIFKIPVQNHAYASYLFVVSSDFSIEPGMAYHRGGPVNTFDFYTDIYIKDKITAGIKYRTSISFIIRAGIKIGDNFEIDYAYDMGAGSMQNYNSGSHEIILIGRFRKKTTVLNTPRFIDD